MWIVLFVVLLDMVGIGIISPLFPFYALRLGANATEATWCMSIYSGALFISTPLVGRLSDRYGRKPVMALSLLGSVIGYLLLMSANSIWMIAISRLLGGAMAGNFSAAQAYITDHSSDVDRGKYLGLFGAAMGLGFFAGPLLGTWLGGHSFVGADLKSPALVAMGLSVFAFFGVLFFVKDTPEASVRSKHLGSSPRSINRLSITAISDLLNNSVHNPNKRSLLVKAIICSTLFQAVSGFYETIFPIWAADEGIISGPRGMLPIFLFSGISYIFILTVLSKSLAQPSHERNALAWAAGSLIIVTYLIPVAGNYKSALATTFLLALSACCMAPRIVCIQTIASRCADPAARGFVFGFLSAAGMLGKTLTTATSGYLYTNVSHHSPYYAAAITAAILLAVTLTLPNQSNKEAQLFQDENIESQPPPRKGLEYLRQENS